MSTIEEVWKLLLSIDIRFYIVGVVDSILLYWGGRGLLRGYKELRRNDPMERFFWRTIFLFPLGVDIFLLVPLVLWIAPPLSTLGILAVMIYAGFCVGTVVYLYKGVNWFQ